MKMMKVATLAVVLYASVGEASLRGSSSDSSSSDHHRALQTSTFIGKCMQDNWKAAGNNADLNCNAKEVTVQSTSVEMANDLTQCTAGSRVLISKLAGEIKFNAERYDPGWYINTEGESAYSGRCALTTLGSYGISQGLYSLTNGGSVTMNEMEKSNKIAAGDLCGDIMIKGGKGTVLTTELMVNTEVLCSDANGDGDLDLSICFSWRVQGKDGMCDPKALFPGTPSKCDCQRIELPSVKVVQPLAAAIAAPTDSPTDSPTNSPTKTPTESPTKSPTKSPTGAPTDSPSGGPTKAPTTGSPTDAPTGSPTQAPTATPTDAPTASPTGAPTPMASIPVDDYSDPLYRDDLPDTPALDAHIWDGTVKAGDKNCVEDIFWDFFVSEMTCAANQVTLEEVTAVDDTPASCVAGDQITVTLRGDILLQSSLIDPGWYLSSDGGDALSGFCQASSFVPEGEYIFDNDEASLLFAEDTCGDLQLDAAGDATTITSNIVVQQEILCEDNNDDGILDFSICFVWKEAVGACLPSLPVPGSSYDCDCQRSDVANVRVTQPVVDSDDNVQPC